MSTKIPADMYQNVLGECMNKLINEQINNTIREAFFFHSMRRNCY